MFNSKSVHMPYELTFAHHVLDIDNLQAVVREEPFDQDLVPVVEALVKVRAELEEERLGAARRVHLRHALERDRPPPDVTPQPQLLVRNELCDPRTPVDNETV